MEPTIFILHSPCFLRVAEVSNKYPWTSQIQLSSWPCLPMRISVCMQQIQLRHIHQLELCVWGWTSDVSLSLVMILDDEVDCSAFDNPVNWYQRTSKQNLKESSRLRIEIGTSRSHPFHIPSEFLPGFAENQQIIKEALRIPCLQ